MAAPRLPFLWPMWFRSTGFPSSHAPAGQTELASRTHRRKEGRRQFRTTPHTADGLPIQRYGKAYEHQPELANKKDLREREGKTMNAPTENAQQARAHEGGQDEEARPSTIDSFLITPPTPDVISEASSASPPNPTTSVDSTAPDSVLHLPTAHQEEKTKPPHLKPPPYVHHFDTYGLVRKLAQSGYTPSQSIIIMKAVRQTLLTNMALARAGLVSKSNVENQTYLFRAACSELKTEIGNRRRAEMERMRSDRNQLQHELDILSQRLGQETAGLREELKGLFDDRKMAVRQEQRSMEARIQELNYKITVALNSDARSEVEGLRWVLTRRAAITVGFSAFMLFVALRYTSYVQHQQQQQDLRRTRPPPTASSLPLEDVAATSKHAQVDRQEALGEELLAREGGSLG